MPTDTSTYDLAGPQNTNSGKPAEPPASSDANAHLIVHTDSVGSDGSGTRGSETPLQRLRALYWGGENHDRRTPLALTLADRHGHELLSVDDAGPTLGIALRPGTYHLTATLGDIRRGYTVSLHAGARFDLHLRFAPIKRPRHLATTGHPEMWPTRSSH